MNDDTLQGKSEKAVGHVKESAGDLTGSQKLHNEGVADQLKGQLHETIGAAKQVGKDVAAGVKDGVNNARRDVNHKK